MGPREPKTVLGLEICDYIHISNLDTSDGAQPGPLTGPTWSRDMAHGPWTSWIMATGAGRWLMAPGARTCPTHGPEWPKAYRSEWTSAPMSAVGLCGPQPPDLFSAIFVCTNTTHHNKTQLNTWRSAQIGRRSTQHPSNLRATYSALGEVVISLDA